MTLIPWRQLCEVVPGGEPGNRDNLNYDAFAAAVATLRAALLTGRPGRSSTCCTRRIETPWKYISAQATSSARSLRCQRANIDGW